MTDILVTGVGAVTCQGYGAAALHAAMTAGAPPVPERLTDLPVVMRHPLIHRVPGVPRGAAELAVSAVREALGDAGLEQVPDLRVGVVLGSCLGDVGPDGSPSFQVASAVGRSLGAFGTNISVSNACAAGGFAVCLAADLIRAGEVDVAITGGADAYSRVGWASFDRLGAVDPVRCRPFDRARQGTILAEGTGILVLESAEHAHRRGASAYARLTGSGWSCDAHHLTAPEPSGEQIIRGMREALGGGEPGCVIPHGTGTVLNDLVESQALRTVLGPGAGRVPLYSAKALLGHTGGASAALGAVMACLILRAGAVPANVPIDEQDPRCEIFLPVDAPVPLPVPRVLVNAYAFGGANASFVLEAA
ncbi:beta-ketoacyl-[acyl-carrier-protein] synthase family protein [Nonomuraea sp. SBT364]|uniref:beta-ketoacyl-[acyl-carrier-protein] synthase family protein n=1 Tax=Nonomuraea sp. SBT364 TaxID=1580530 RepID=UPI00066E42FD|nr:beta-ketoacyl synthase N-terminal-like domain-containing protein [Nonomuraea sp. SBT364]